MKFQPIYDHVYEDRIYDNVAHEVGQVLFSFLGIQSVQSILL